MRNVKTKFATGVTVVFLGGLAGVALSQAAGGGGEVEREGGHGGGGGDD